MDEWTRDYGGIPWLKHSGGDPYIPPSPDETLTGVVPKQCLLDEMERRARLIPNNTGSYYILCEDYKRAIEPLLRGFVFGESGWWGGGWKWAGGGVFKV